MIDAIIKCRLNKKNGVILIVIPKRVRDKLHIKTDDHFQVSCNKNQIIYTKETKGKAE